MCVGSWVCLRACVLDWLLMWSFVRLFGCLGRLFDCVFEWLFLRLFVCSIRFVSVCPCDCLLAGLRACLYVLI